MFSPVYYIRQSEKKGMFVRPIEWVINLDLFLCQTATNTSCSRARIKRTKKKQQNKNIGSFLRRIKIIATHKQTLDCDKANDDRRGLHVSEIEAALATVAIRVSVSMPL